MFKNYAVFAQKTKDLVIQNCSASNGIFSSYHACIRRSSCLKFAVNTNNLKPRSLIMKREKNIKIQRYSLVLTSSSMFHSL